MEAAVILPRQEETMHEQHAQALCDFIDASPTAYHAVEAAVAMLEAAGASQLDERAAWRLTAGNRYYVIRDGASIIAFQVGMAAPAEAGFAMAGAHTDAPGLRARIEKRVTSRGMERVAVEVYGGPIHATWLDRPLSLAGRVVLCRQAPSTPVDAKPPESAGPVVRLVNFARPVAIIPNLAIHFNREMNKGIEFPVHTALLPLVAARRSQSAAMANGIPEPQVTWIMQAVAAELGVEPHDIVSAELAFVDASGAILFGDDEEIISAPRLDNLAGCHAILTAFCSASPGAHGQVAALFDNEEIGSATHRGANSAFLRDVLARICLVNMAGGVPSGGTQFGVNIPAATTVGGDLSGSAQLGAIPGGEDLYRAMARSYLVSVDGAQAWHPAYADRFDDEYAPLLNGGPAIKANANVKYATDAIGEAAFIALCNRAGVPYQRFRMRADLTPGSTIGPVSSALLGVRTVDVGMPMLAMHSARETAGSKDHAMMIGTLKAFYTGGPGQL
jgi:aspartyl aminopeptidase